MRHHAFVVTSYDTQKLVVVWDFAKSLKLDVSGFVSSALNGYVSFFVAPDGSKEGWEASRAGDLKRDLFVEFLDEQRFEDGSTAIRWAELRYGDDEHETLIVRHSDESRYYK